jgi:DNA-directed RNA polymerase subunit RPC12/RpoP
MANRIQIPKVTVNGKDYNMCPICGGPCTTSCWNNHKRCAECQKLIVKGHTIDETKVIRMRQRNLVIEDVRKKLIPKAQKERMPYNFKNRLPDGVTVKGITDKESQLLTQTYRQYFGLYGHIAEFNSLINPILTSTLESHKVTEFLLASDIEATTDKNKKISVSERKDYLDIQTKMDEQIRKSSKLLDEIKNNRVSQSGNILINEFKKMIRFHHEQDQYYMGVGVCEKCQSRIIFKTEFPTFKNRYEDLLQKELEEMRKEQNFDENTINSIEKRIKKRLDDDSFSDTYVNYHVRELEKALM